MPVDHRAVADALAQANAKTGLFPLGRVAPGAVETPHPADIARFLDVVQILGGFEAVQRAVRGQGAFSSDTQLPDPATVRVMAWLATLAETPGHVPEPAPPPRVRWGVPVSDASDGGGG